MENEIQFVFRFFIFMKVLKNRLLHPSPVFVEIAEIIKKSDFRMFWLIWLALLIFQLCCGTDLREVLLVSVN